MENPRTLDDEIQTVLESLENLPVGTEDYDSAVKNLRDLATVEEIRAKAAKTQAEATKTSEDKITKAQWLSAGINVAGILAVLHYEKLGVITSKAFGLISKIRL